MVDPVLVYTAIAAVFGILLIVMGLLGGLGGIFDIGVGGDVGVDVGGGPDVGDVGTDVATDAGQFSGVGISPLSLPVLFIFGTFFGAFGAILEITRALPTLAVPVFAMAFSMLITGITYFALLKLFAGTQVTTQYKLGDLIGARGQITIPVEPESRGQVLVVTEARGRTLLSAISSQSLETGDRVKVVGVEGNALVVEKL